MRSLQYLKSPIRLLSISPAQAGFGSGIKSAQKSELIAFGFFGLLNGIPLHYTYAQLSRFRLRPCCPASASRVCIKKADKL
jgi:hypothetical protein